MSTKAQREQMEESRAYLRTLFNPGDTVHTIVRHVSRSGMMRVISVHYVNPSGELVDISRHVAWAIDQPFDRDRWGVKMGGAGMDMTFALAYSLGRALWPDGVPCTGSTGRTAGGNKSRIPMRLSNDHFNGDRDYHKGKLHRDGGYALRNRNI